MMGLLLLPLVVAYCSADDAKSGSVLETKPDSIWESEIGAGFRKNARSIELKFSRAFGTTDGGSNVPHDLWLSEIQAGLMLADVMEPDHWFGGNLEGLLQGIAGGQERPHAAYFVAVNGGLRYHFRTNTRWVPFLTASVGVGITDIDDADATGKFQFNEQVGTGVRYFFDRTHAVTAEYGLWHISNGGVREPNDGVNAHVFSVGFSWLF
jgi:hypothetical protein